jgi:hypothetical protein
MLSFYTPNNLIEDDRFSKIHYNTTFQDSALNGASVTPVSGCHHGGTIFGTKLKFKIVWWHEVHTKFHEYQPLGGTHIRTRSLKSVSAKF